MDQKKLVNFLAFWVASTIVILISAVLFGNNVVLGNDKLSPSIAAIIAGFVLTGLNFLIPDMVKKGGLDRNLQSLSKSAGLKIKDEYLWAVIFFVANTVIIWLVKRFAIITGVGISSIVWVIVVAILLTVVQWGVGKTIGMMKKNN